MCWFVVLFAVTQVPLYWVQYPDIVDLPNHLARLHVLINFSESEILQRYYTLRNWQIGTNLAMEVVVPILARWIDLLLAFKIFASLATLLMTTGAVALGRAINGRFSYLLLGVLLFAQNIIFQTGLLNYLFGLGAALWLLAAWVHFRERYSLCHWITFSLGSILVYLCHLSAFGVYAVGVFGYELGRNRTPEVWLTRSTLEALLRSSMQFIPVGTLHALVSTSSGSYAPVQLDAPWLTIFQVYVVYKAALLANLVPLSISGYKFSMLGYLVVFVLYVGFREGVLTVVAPIRWVSCALAACLLLLPYAGFGSELLDIRLMPALVLILWSGLRIHEHSKLPHNVVLAFIVAIVFLISALTTREYALRDDEYRQVRGALSKIPMGSKAATVSLAENNDLPIISPHTGAWSVVDRSAFLSNLYVWPFVPVWVAYRTPYDSLATLARLDARRPPLAYENVKKIYDYVLIYGGSEAERMEYAPNTKPIFDSPSFRLLQTKHDH